MAKNIPDINENFDTVGSWIARTNEVLEVLRTEVLTANSSGGVTGSTLNPLDAQLIGSFTANTLEVSGGFRANTTVIEFTAPLTISGNVGLPGQVLTSNGSTQSWQDPATGSGTVTQIQTGSGLSGGPISTSGSIQVRANTGIIANTSGLFVDRTFVEDVVGDSGNATQLLGRTWVEPGAIGETTANTGTFTTLSATSAIRFNGATLVSTTGISSPGFVGGTTPDAGSQGGLTLRARGNNSLARLQVTNNNGSTEWGRLDITTNLWDLIGADLRVDGVEVGYRTIPQEIVSANTQIDTTQDGGKHLYKTVSTDIELTVPDNSSDPADIGTTITVINDGSNGNITLVEGGSTVLQLGGTIDQGNRTIGPGGVATMVKVQTNKWIVTGPGVV